MAQLGRMVATATDGEALSLELARAGGRARVPAWVETFGDAMVIANLMGRAEVLDEAEEEDGPALAEPQVGTVTFDEAQEFLRQKVSMPTERWTDMLGRGHDRAFVVAGATDMALLGDLRTSLTAALDGGGLEEFKRDFDQIVAKHGWAHTGEAARRAETIFDTNLKTSRAAGRFAQMRDPEMMKLRPYWRYVHADLREPASPRAAHVAWDGLVLPADDPIWDTIYPPNGWGCSCGVRSVSRAGLKRLGKDGPDRAPKLPRRKVRDPATDGAVELPEGIDLGWDHAPGRTWFEGVVPRELAEPMPPFGGTATDPRQPLSAVARPFAADVLPEGREPEFYVEQFLRAFGAATGPDGGVVWRDRLGHALPISEQMFRTKGGQLKVLKEGRSVWAARLAETMTDPDEIWLNWGRGPKPILKRVYLRHDPVQEALTIFHWTMRGWHQATAFVNNQGRSIDAQRTGALLYRREGR